MNAHPTPQPGPMPAVDPVVKSMVDHPAGRRMTGTRPDGRPDTPDTVSRESVRIPGAVSCHGPRYDSTVGGARMTRDAVPGDFPPALWVLMEIFGLLALVGVVGVVLRLVWQGLGPVGLAALGVGVCLSWVIHWGAKGGDPR